MMRAAERPRNSVHLTRSKHIRSLRRGEYGIHPSVASGSNRLLIVLALAGGIASCQAISGVGDLVVVGSDAGSYGGSGGRADGGGGRDSALPSDAPPDGAGSDREAADAPDSADAPDMLSPPVPLAPVRSIVLPLSRDGLMTDVFAVLGDGKVYVNHRATADGRYTGFGRATGAEASAAPPYASLAGACRDSRHVEIFYVDLAGQIRTIFWDPDASVYRGGRLRDEPGAGGDATAPPGTSPSVVAMSSRRLDLFLVDNTGTAVVFEWTDAAGWKAPAPLSNVGRFSPGAPLTAVSRWSGNTLDVFGVDKEGFAWVAQCDQGCDGSNWTARRFADQPRFGPGAALGVLVRDPTSEDVFGVDGDGRVWRAWWSDPSGSWSHPPDYLPFGAFSRQFMLTPGAYIETNTRNADICNLSATNDKGAMINEWWENGAWQPQAKAWDSTLVDDAWPVFDRGWGSVEADMPMAMLGNVGASEAADIYWTKRVESGDRQIWTIRVRREPGFDWFWTPYFRIDNLTP
jgi:hypothetical protein